MKINMVIFEKSAIKDTGQIRDGNLILNQNIWQRLEGTSEKNFVLLLDDKYLTLLTETDFYKNKFIQGKFRTVRTIYNSDSGKVLEVAEKITNSESNISNFWNALITTFPILGVGGKSPIDEGNNTMSNNQKLFFLGGLAIFMTIILFFLFKD